MELPTAENEAVQTTLATVVQLTELDDCTEGFKVTLLVESGLEERHKVC